MKRIRRLFQDERAEVERELLAHIALRAEAIVREGGATTWEEAEAVARREFDADSVSAECIAIRLERNRERERSMMLDALRQDIRYGWRTLLRSRAFTATAVLVLGIGFGAVITVGTVVRAVLLRPLPYPNGDALVRITERNVESGERDRGISVPLYADIRAQAHSFTGVGIVSAQAFVNREREEAVRLQGATVSASIFPTLDVRPVLGRWLSEADVTTGARVALIGEGLWREWYGASDEVLSRTIQLMGEPHQIIGVMPASFDFPNEDSRVWVGLQVQDYMKRRDVHVVSAIARLKSGIDRAVADREVQEIYRRGQEAEPGSDAGDQPYTVALRDDLVGPGRHALLLLLAAASLVLLLAAANVSGLLIARGAARSGELNTRLALGAGRFAVMRQLMVESLLIGMVAATLGLALSTVGARALHMLALARIPGLDIVELDATTVALTFMLTLITALLVGLVPAWRASRMRGAGAAGMAGDRLTSSRQSHQLRQAVVVVQTALAITLVYAAAVLVRSFVRVQSQDPGVRADNVLIMQISPSLNRVVDVAGVVAYYHALPARVEAIPGVISASATNTLPISGGDSHGMLTIEGKLFAPGQAPGASYRRILPNYFATMGMRLIAGREFTPDDGARDPKVVIIGEGMARRHFGTAAAALDRRIKVGPPEAEPWLTIVGVVNDVRNERLEAIDEYATYEPHPQRPWQQMYLAVRTHAEPLTVAGAVRAELLRDDPAILIENVSTMGEQIRASVAPRRLTSQLVAALGGIAVMLSAIGIYGLFATAVIDRNREFAIRAALGAANRRLLQLVLGDSMRVGLLGIALGLLGALMAGAWLRTMLYASDGREPLTLVIAACTLMLTTIVASLLPARRAARVPPATALRS